ncbi:hypothetical protein OLMES_0255 [Oleiphilus messinensis]|uniref:Uncharacterized protein n=1 Tax=Oleiphilus messinensis TaxID=141451 RepID=A0A1Y0I1T2_9GAMM|nr:hypothetical protein [Oleiphilus messinensis]ARU54361.1 hypothetical protein OLMES_0255 [Oleiphilus messinensis]
MSQVITLQILLFSIFIVSFSAETVSSEFELTRFKEAIYQRDIVSLANQFYFDQISGVVNKVRLQRELDIVFTYFGNVTNCRQTDEDNFAAIVLVSSTQEITAEREFKFQCEFSKIGHGAILVKTITVENQKLAFSFSIGVTGDASRSKELWRMLKSPMAQIMGEENRDNVYFLENKYAVFLEREECIDDHYSVRYKTFHRLLDQTNEVKDEVGYLLADVLAEKLMSCDVKKIIVIVSEVYSGQDEVLGRLLFRFNESKKEWQLRSE